MRRAGYGRGIGAVIGCGGALLLLPLVAAFKFLSDIAWPFLVIFGLFATFIGGCVLVMGLSKLVMLWAENYEKRHPEAFRAMREAEVQKRLEQFNLEQSPVDRL